MKKILSLVCGSLLAISLVACGGASKGDTTTPKPAGDAAAPAGDPAAAPAPGAANPCTTTPPPAK